MKEENELESFEWYVFVDTQLCKQKTCSKFAGKKMFEISYKNIGFMY